VWTSKYLGITPPHPLREASQVTRFGMDPSKGPDAFTAGAMPSPFGKLPRVIRG
jgi:hypothetical protein